MPVARVQSVHLTGSGTTYSGSVTSTAGNTLVVTIGAYARGTVPTPVPVSISSISDGANTWQYSTAQQAQQPPAAGSYFPSSNFYGFAAAGCAVNVASGAHTVTVTLSASCYATVIYVHEFSGVSTSSVIDASAATGVESSVASYASPAVTTTATSSLVVVTATEDSGWTGATAPYTLVASTDAAWNAPGSAGSQSGTLTAGGYQTATAGVTLAVGVAGTLAVSTTSLPHATATDLYSQPLNAGGGTGAGYTWSISSGSLPSWASLSAAGVISGTAPATSGSTTFTVQVTDSGSHTATQSLTLQVDVPQPSGSPSGGPWTLAFQDEFAGSTWDPAVWSPNLIFGPQWRTTGDSTQAGWSPHDNRGMSVASSVLSLISRFEDPHAADALCPVPLPNGNTGTYTIGFLSSHPGFSFTEGYVEYRIRVPPAKLGAWPAAWSKTRYNVEFPENDVFEYNVNGSGSQSDVNYITTGGAFNDFFGTIADNGWHVYGCRITASDLTYFWDGSQVYTTANDGTTPPWVLILDHWATTANSSGTGFPLTADFDYARVWVVTGVPAQPVITALSPSTGVPSAGAVAVSFGAVSGATSYRAVACPVDTGAVVGPPAGIPSPLFNTGSSSPITVTGLTNGTAYNFTVSAINATGYSIESPVVASLAPVTRPQFAYQMRRIG